MMHIGSAEIVSRIGLPGVPSASGMVREGDFFWIIGDDSPWIFKVGRDGLVVDKKLWLLDSLPESGRIPKPVKPDFEMMEWVPGSSQLLVMGSGSVKESRCRVLIWDLLSDSASLDAAFPELFQFWEEGAEMEPGLLNLEGMAVLGDELVLVNRLPKVVFQMNFEELLLFWKGAGDLPGFTSTEFPPLPSDPKGLGFSGAATCPLNDFVLVCLSTEDTPNSYDDGAVGASYLGLFGRLVDLDDSFDYVPITENGLPVLLKVESVVMGEVLEEGIWQVFAVTDADGGVSELLELRVTLRQPI